MKVINEFENDSGGKTKSSAGKKMKVNGIIVSKNPGLLNIRHQILL